MQLIMYYAENNVICNEIDAEKQVSKRIIINIATKKMVSALYKITLTLAHTLKHVQLRTHKHTIGDICRYTNQDQGRTHIKRASRVQGNRFGQYRYFITIYTLYAQIHKDFQKKNVFIILHQYFSLVPQASLATRFLFLL